MRRKNRNNSSLTKSKTRFGKSLLVTKCDDIVQESELSTFKKPDELKVGDKFKVNTCKFKVLAVGYDKYFSEKEYYSVRIGGRFDGSTEIVNTKNIDEIIYEEEQR